MPHRFLHALSEPVRPGQNRRLPRLLFCLALVAPAAHAAEIRVAVAANFAGPAKEIAARFSAEHGHTARIATGSTGKLFAQIVNGAPFDVLLAADDIAPRRLEADGHAVPGTRFSYSIGRLVLWSAQPGLVDDAGKILAHGSFRHLALANPKVAPYGRAAAETMTALGVHAQLSPRFVLGENIAQAHQFVASGNAELGFVALSQVVGADGRIASGSGWPVPARLHTPIRQDAALLARGRDNPAASAFLDYLKGETARTIIRRFGYNLP